MLVVLLVLNVPVGFALLAASMVSLAYGGVPMALVVQRMTTSADSFVLLAIPLFIFAGALMSRGGMAQAIFDFAEALVGFVRGGLAKVNIATSMFFGGITGAAVADTSAVGSIMIKPMLDRGFDRGLTAAVTASSSTIGVMIPPSIPMILFAVVTGVSLGKLSLAEVVPGIVVGLVLMATTRFLLRNGNVPVMSFSGSGSVAPSRSACRHFCASDQYRWHSRGIVTPTEAAVLAVAYALLLGMVTGKLRWREIVDSAVETAVASRRGDGRHGCSRVGFRTGPRRVSRSRRRQPISVMSQMTDDSPLLLLFLIVLLYLVAGAILALGANIIVLVPVLYPMVLEFGISNLNSFRDHHNRRSRDRRRVTPPVGVSALFVASSIAGISIAAASRAVGFPSFLRCLRS